MIRLPYHRRLVGFTVPDDPRREERYAICGAINVRRLPKTSLCNAVEQYEVGFWILNPNRADAEDAEDAEARLVSILCIVSIYTRPVLPCLLRVDRLFRISPCACAIDQRTLEIIAAARGATLQNLDTWCLL